MSEEKKSEKEDDSVTAVDYVNTQVELERDALELMPYDPKTCTYMMGELRQNIFACLTCSKLNDNQPVGVCYSCSIQCHSTHELVELFSKRSFVCDCGTTRMAKTPNGACKIRLNESAEKSSHLGSPKLLSGKREQPGRRINAAAEDIPSSSNKYGQNFKGLFCHCSRSYNPLEETGTMIQCHFGLACDEDWYHDRCILGFSPLRETKRHSSGNILNELSSPGEDAESQSPEVSNEKSQENVLADFPDTSAFDAFICWKCTEKFSSIFRTMREDPDITLLSLPHFDYLSSPDEWKKKYRRYIHAIKSSDEHTSKKIKLESHDSTFKYSLFLKMGFRDRLAKLSSISEKNSALNHFLKEFKYIYEDDPIFEPPEEQNFENSTSTSLLHLGANALSSIPRDQAIEGLQAYDKMRDKLRTFLKPFAEEGKIVTEDEVRNFFKDNSNES